MKSDIEKERRVKALRVQTCVCLWECEERKRSDRYWRRRWNKFLDERQNRARKEDSGWVTYTLEGGRWYRSLHEIELLQRGLHCVGGRSAILVDVRRPYLGCSWSCEWAKRRESCRGTREKKSLSSISLIFPSKGLLKVRFSCLIFNELARSARNRGEQRSRLLVMLPLAACHRRVWITTFVLAFLFSAGFGLDSGTGGVPYRAYAFGSENAKG